MKIGDPGVHWGGADVAHCQMIIGSKLAPAMIDSLRLALFTKSRDFTCGEAPGP